MKNNLQLSLAAFSCALLLGLSPAAWTAEAARTVSVSGQGEVQAEPDRAQVTLGVESRKPTLEAARAEVTKTVDAVLKLARELNIDPKYVQATRVNVQPEYNWDNGARERNMIGYYVSRQVEIDLRDLEKLGVLLERAFDLGVNQVGDPQLGSTQRRQLERQALVRAVEDARLNAEAVAKAAGATVGTVRTISATAQVAMPPVPMRMKATAMAEAADGAEQTYETGQMNFTGEVQVEYDLIPAPAR